MITATMLQDTSNVSSWNTTNAGSASNTVVIPTSSTGTYGCTVDWGDGTTSNISTYNDPSWTHVYGSTGTYNIKIYGTFNGIVFDALGDKLKILSVSKWGCNFRLGTTQGTYYDGCANLTVTATDALILNGTTSLASCFTSCTSLSNVPNINLWDVSNVTSLASIFSGAALFNQSLNSWNTGNVSAMNSVFSNATAYNQSLSNWNVSNVTTMNSMFRGTTYNQSLSSWNVSKVENFGSTFSRSSSGAGANPSISGWNTSSATNMSGFAQNNTTFNQTSISSFVTSSVTNMSSMFNGATSANPDVHTWNIGALTNATTMFTSSGFTETNYNLLLDSGVGWPSQATIQSGVVFSAGSAHYSGTNAINGRATLTSTYTWTITDGGTP